MYKITEAYLQTLTLEELFKARDAMQILVNLGVREMDTDVRNLVDELIIKREEVNKNG